MTSSATFLAWIYRRVMGHVQYRTKPIRHRGGHRRDSILLRYVGRNEERVTAALRSRSVTSGGPSKGVRPAPHGVRLMTCRRVG